MKTEESGKRIKVRGTINCHADALCIRMLVKQLAGTYGGCTVLPLGVGYWVDEDGKVLGEPATIVEVSFKSSWHINQVRQFMTETQAFAGGTWCHIEVSEFEAAHTHVDHFRI